MPPDPVFFVDENNHRNQAILQVFAKANIRIERHCDHFAVGTPDEVWLPTVGARGWALLTTDTRIRYRFSELAQVLESRVCLFCFSRNNQSAAAMAETLKRALPHMLTLLSRIQPPFIATIDKTGKVTQRDFPRELLKRTS